jgi:hypothetical protein
MENTFTTSLISVYFFENILQPQQYFVFNTLYSILLQKKQGQKLFDPELFLFPFFLRSQLGTCSLILNSEFRIRL